jgi:hypothetical protein
MLDCLLIFLLPVLSLDLGTIWTASAHIITAVIGSGVLSLAWATAQLDWMSAPSFCFFSHL